MSGLPTIPNDLTVSDILSALEPPFSFEKFVTTKVGRTLIEMKGDTAEILSFFVPKLRVNGNIYKDIDDFKCNALWSMLPYQYRAEGQCHSFYAHDILSIFWTTDSPLQHKYPASYRKIIHFLTKTHQYNEMQSYNSLLETFENVTLYDLKYYIKLYCEHILKTEDKDYQDFMDFTDFLADAQFGDVIFLNAFHRTPGTYIFGFGDTDYDVLFHHFIRRNNCSNVSDYQLQKMPCLNDNNNDGIVDISKYLKLIPIANVFEYGLYKEFNRRGPYCCIPIEFCDAPITYFTELPLNNYGDIEELRIIDPNRMNFNSYKENPMIERLNEEILDVLNGEKKEIDILYKTKEFDPDEDDYGEWCWEKKVIDITSEKTTGEFPKNYFVLCDDLETADSFVWLRRNWGKMNKVKYMKKYKSYPIHCAACTCDKIALSKRFKKCSNCQLSYYCSRHCQKVGWKHDAHRMICPAIDGLDFRGLGIDGWVKRYQDALDVKQSAIKIDLMKTYNLDIGTEAIQIITQFVQ